MPAAIHVFAAGIRPPLTTRHPCPFQPCSITLAGITAACKRHRGQLPVKARTALITAWASGRGKSSGEFAAALQAAKSALEAKRAGQS